MGSRAIVTGAKIAALTLLLFFVGSGPARASQGVPPVHNSRLLYSGDEMLEFDLEGFLGRKAPNLEQQADEIRHWSAYSSISPRVALTLLALESRSGLKSLIPDTLLADRLRTRLTNLADALYSAFERRVPGSVDEVDRYAATSALATTLGSTDLVQEFVAVYGQLFPRETALWRPSATSLASSIPIGLKVIPPADMLQLPYGVGRTWSYGGTHSYTGTNSGPPSSLDLARNWPPWGSNTSDHWVRAANAGTAVVHSSCFLAVVGSGGWSTSYYHLDNIIVSTGQTVARDQKIANYANNIDQALCGGGHSQTPHVHFSLRRNGVYTSLAGVSLSGFTVHPGRTDYDSDCDYFWLERDGIKYCAWTNLTNPGVPNTAPAAPGNFVAVALSNSSIYLSWADLATNETSFEIERLDGSWSTIAIVAANSTDHTDHNLDSGTSYSYRIRARNGGGTSAWVGPAIAITAGERPPADLLATALSSSQIRLTWTDRSTGETSFEIESLTAGGSFVPMLSVSAESEEVLIEGLDSETSYTFRVRAAGGSGPSSFSNQATAITFLADPEPCEPSATTLCLNDGRFSVDVVWRDFNDVTGEATAVPVPSADSGLLWFFSDNNWELMVKVLDGCAFNERFWVFAAATTDVEYRLRVVDSYTGNSSTYVNELGTAAPAITDTNAFSTCHVTTPPWGDPVVLPPEKDELSAPVCAHDPSRLCLADGRFEVEVEWQDFQGEIGPGNVVPYGSTDSGMLWFFSLDNWEMLVKVLDGCAHNGHYWVFAAATTDVAYTLKITDLETASIKQYHNELGTAANATTDTSAFAICDP